MQIDFNIVDDLDVSHDPDVYQDAGNPPPPPAGNYRIKVEKWSLRKTQDGELIMDLNDAGRPAFPKITLEMVQIVEPFPFTDRKVGLYQDFKTKPFRREGDLANYLSDMVRSLDVTRSFSGLKAGLETFDELVEAGNTLSVYADWTWYDTEYVKAKMDEMFDGRNYGALTDDEKKLAGSVYNTAKFKGMKKNKVNGKFSHIWTNPASGNKVEAKWQIVKFHNSRASVRYYVVEN